MKPFDILTTTRDALATVPGVTTCRIGLEANMTPADYPMVRVVPSRTAYGAVIGARRVEALIYFGKPVHEFTAGLEAEYQALLTMEGDLLAKLGSMSGVSCEYVETILDEDRVDAYKLMALRVNLEA